MRSGRIKYYGSIPTSITGSWPSYGSTDQRFWVEFIDHVLGFSQTSAGIYMDLSGISSSNHHDRLRRRFHLGNRDHELRPHQHAATYMNYKDNPARGLCCASGSARS